VAALMNLPRALTPALHTRWRSTAALRAVLLGLMLAVCLPAAAQNDPAALERRIKAAFLYKFADYVEWPDGTFPRPNAPITVGVAGDDQIATELAQVAASRTADGRPLQVKRLREGDSLAGVHVLFVGRQDAARLLPLARATQTQPILLVSESDAALTQGSIINFVMTGGRVRFEIALDNAERRGLKLSSRLLTVAQSIRTSAP